MKFFFAFLAASTFANAFAKEITFPEDVYGGATTYRCNAGLKSSERQDYISAQTEHWNESESTWSPAGPMQTLMAGFDTYNSMVNPETQFARTLQRLQFTLNSTKTSSSYFVDTCYDGPQIPYFSENPLEEVKTNVFIHTELALFSTDSATGSAISGGSPYTSLAKAEYRTMAACDKQGEGAFRFAEDKGIDIDFDAFYAGKQGNSDFFVASEFKPLVTSTTEGFPLTWVTSNSSHMPRYCVIRHEVRETSGADRARGGTPRFHVFSRVEESMMD